MLKPGSALCVACGLCCDGSLFRLVALGRGEAEKVQARGLVVHGVAGREHIKQPCSALDGATCTIYEDRPTTCRWYRCALLKGVLAGQVDEGAAVAFVRDQRGLAAGLLDAIGHEDLVESLDKLVRDGDSSALMWREMLLKKA